MNCYNPSDTGKKEGFKFATCLRQKSRNKGVRKEVISVRVLVFLIVD